MSETLEYTIANIHFSIHYWDKIVTNPVYQPFRTTRNNDFASAYHVDINMTLCTADKLQTQHLTKLFESGQSWALYQTPTGLKLVYYGGFRSSIWAAEINHDYSSVTIFCDQTQFNHPDALKWDDPFHSILDKFLATYILITHGIILHSAGVKINNQGYLFAGRSNIGKSTFSKQCLKYQHALLSDDRVVILKNTSTFDIYSTPWSGDPSFVLENFHIPLAGIFFLQQGNDNKAHLIPKTQAMEKLLPVLTMPLYDRELLPPILDFAEQMVTHIPTYVLTFTPDINIADILDKHF